MRLTPEQVAETRAAMCIHTHPDGRPNAEQIARALNLAPSTVKNRLRALGGRSYNEFTPVYQKSDKLDKPRDQFSSYLEIHGPAREQVRARVKEWKADLRSSEPVYKVLAIGDPHDKPGRDKERFAWIGRHARETRPDAIVCIGDMASLDSLSSHELPGSAADAERPSFPEELESLNDALSSFHRHLPVGTIPTYITLGNHENRAWRSANKQPKQCGDMPFRLETIFTQYRWQTKPFGEFLELYGVDFVHCPLNVMGREMGGEHVERTVANKAMRSIVFGHTHKRNLHNAIKVGQSRKITALNLGTSMPYGMIEKYSGLSMTGWSYGVYELRIQAGAIISEKFYDMLELEERWA